MNINYKIFSIFYCVFRKLPYICINKTGTTPQNKKLGIMKALNHYTISAAEKNRVLKMQTLKQMSNQTFNVSNLRTKISATRFKKQYGISLESAPLSKIENGCIWKLVHFFGTSKKFAEKLEYVPMYQMANA